ncbi:hypothetical protein GCM10027084_14450 [Pseudoxanthomonas sangjuensis]|uniref:hypothetical protein n=1 Tax=Pseudoxanthomonas sangjuensis TaxID=1503750 RepID=UPI001390B066|nr:hypothetical protein [Pseudoxanthomonas sangjuensis]KAF1715743.1 hypothetical protein CSC71_00420 [Pseudoxanthomonas sangjuensis]
MHDCRLGERLAQLLDADDVDAAIEAGLVAFAPCPACDEVVAAKIVDAQARLAKAWAARERYRAREARLARIAAERAARRSPPQAQKSSLPPAAAAVLARAKAKAAQRGDQ